MGGKPGATKQNEQLFDHGIQNENSHVRAHVCPQIKRVYVFPTAEGVAALSLGKEVAGYQPGVEGPTAKGRLVPPFEIARCVALQIRECAWEKIGFLKEDDSSKKGAKAVQLVVAMMRAGLFPLPSELIVDPDLSKDIQVTGNDIFVWTQKNCIKIQVKCDWSGGEKSLGGSGALFLQTAERNPLKKT